MPRDASHQQVTHEFSFVNLSSPNKTNPNVKPNLEQPNISGSTTLPEKRPASAIVATADTSSVISTDWYQADHSNYNLSLSEIINSTADNSTNHDLSQPKNYLGQILFVLSVGYCIFGVWWLFGHEANRIATRLIGGKQVILSRSDAEFINYLERSLNYVDRELAAKEQLESEVVYVPVYTPAPSTAPERRPVTSSSSQLPTVTPSSAPSKPELPVLKIPAPPPLSEPTPISKNAPPSSQVEVNKPKVQQTLSTLIGILDLGETSSAALVKTKGKTRRVLLGEEINSGGWILESVGDQRAKISYQGQVRSVAVGETF